MSNRRLTTGFLALSFLVAGGLFATRCAGRPPGGITSPEAALGFAIGDDYQLANYTQLSAYWQRLDDESDRVSVVEYGQSSEGRPMLMAIVTAPGNHARLETYRSIARRLALAEGLTDEEARRLASEGKAVVWIDAGLHATEVANVPALTQLIYELASRSDAETNRILDDVILLAALSNPDGLELVANWYMREPEPSKRSTSNLPVLYQKYVGHDNNRESLLMNMPESQAIGRVLYHDWFPQVVFNLHQSGPAGAVIYVGQMRDPSNPFLDPLMAPSMELVSAAIHTRFIAEGKPGATCRSAASYQNWWNGGIRSTACFHNQIAILSEISGGPTPMSIAFVPRNMVATNDNPFPVGPRTWHFRDAIDYLLTANRAVLDIASEHREDFLFNIYRMGKNGIDKGSRDNWTITANDVASLEKALEAGGVGPSGRGTYPPEHHKALFDPASRDPRGYVIPADQPDFPTAVKFVNALVRNGVTVHRATSDFEVAGRTYPAGSFVVKTAQAFRPHILDNFEPQDYPDDFEYPGGPPVRPYDVTGYTLAYQMGVEFDRILDGFDGPFEKLERPASPPPGTVGGDARSPGYLISHRPNDVFVAINRLLAAGEEVYWLAGDGTVYVPAREKTRSLLEEVARQTGLNVEAATETPRGEAFRLRPLRVGVLDVYGGSMPSGWLQWLLARFEFPVKVVYPPDIDAGSLAASFDVIVLENGLVPEPGRPARQASLDPASIPAEYRNRIGQVTEARTIPQLRQFVLDGGTIVAVGSSTAIAAHLELPVENALVDADGKRPLPPEKFYIPGSILRARTDPAHPIAYGLRETFDIFYNNNPLFRLPRTGGIRPVAWIGEEDAPRSGWAWGLDHAKGGVAVADAEVGKGRVILIGPLVVFRAHPHGTFKLMFNSLHYGAAERVRLGESTSPGSGTW